MANTYDIYNTPVLEGFAVWETEIVDDEHYVSMSIFEPANPNACLTDDDVPTAEFTEVIVAFRKDHTFDEAADITEEFLKGLTRDTSYELYVVAFNILEKEWLEKGTLVLHRECFRVYNDAYTPETLGPKLRRGNTRE